MIVDSYKNESHQEENEYLSNALLQSKTKFQIIHSCTIFRADLKKKLKIKRYDYHVHMDLPKAGNPPHSKPTLIIEFNSKKGLRKVD